MNFLDGFLSLAEIAAVERASAPLGLIGVLVYLGAYFALQIGWMRGQGYSYPALNLVAAVLVLVSLTTDFNLAAAIIQVSFIAISLVGLARTWMGRMLLRLTDQERWLLASKFPELRGHRARQFLDAGTWHRVAAGTRLTTEGVPSSCVTFVASGAVDIWSGGQRLYRYGSDVLIGEISCLTASPATATTVIAENARVFSIECRKLRSLILRDAELRLCVEAGFSRDTRIKIIERNATFREFVEKSAARVKTSADPVVPCPGQRPYAMGTARDMRLSSPH